jgi:large subunit ribosomal protein L23
MADSTATVEAKKDVVKLDTGDAYRILIKPIVSEKSYTMAPGGKFVFKVNRKANKLSIRKAIEAVYDVHVTRVNTLNVEGKSRAFGKTRGTTAPWKKAIVTLKTGETIGDATI